MNRSILWTIIGGFFLLGLLIYGQSLSNGFVRWDDGLLIYENPAIRGINLENLTTIFSTYDPELYIPFTLFTYQVDYAIAGTNATFYHFHSLIHHITNALLVVWFIRRLCANTWIAIVTGLLFLIHPLNTEAVAWASGRKDTLSTVFFLLSCIGYDIYRDSEKKQWYLISILSLLLGLFAKVTVLTAPAIFLLIDYLQERKIRIRFIIPYLLLSILFAIIAFFGKTGVIDASTPMEKILVAPMSIVFYLQKLIVPIELSVIYPLTGSVEFFSERILVPIIICSALVILGLYFIKKNRILFFGLVFFALTLSPTLLNISKGDSLYFASDRYAYISSIGILYLVSCIAYWIYRKQSKLTILGLFGLLGFFGILTFRQSLVWANSEALFSHALKYYPEAHTAHNNIGNIQRSRGDLDAAINSYNQALALSTEYGRGESAARSQSKILSNLASTYRANGDNDDALDSIQKAEKLNPLNAHAKLQKGLLAASKGDLIAAETSYQQALELKPQFTTAQVNLGSLYVSQNRFDEAIAILSSATEENPFYPQAFYNLGVAFRKLQKNREALEAYKKAVELEPAFVAARINLGILYAERKKIDEAITQFAEVLKYDPQNARAKSALQQLQRR